jgi:membrane protein
MSVTSRLDAYQRRHPAAGFPLAVVYKYFDDQGGYLAALMTYYGFLSIFPLLLLASTVLGLLLVGHPEAQQAVLRSALREFPVIGSQLQQPSRIGGGATGLVVGGLGALYGGSGIALAAQNAMNTAWRVPRNSRPNPVRARLLSIVLLAMGGLAVLATTGLSALGGGAGAYGAGVRALAIAASMAVNAGGFVVGFRLATARPLTVRQVLPGAIGAAAVWQLLQLFGAGYISHVVRGASGTNGVFALVLGMIGFIYLASVAVVLCVEVNAVRTDRLYPRALLTPVTDHVDLTSADERSYTAQAKAQRNKGFQEIDVRFDK